VSELWSHVSSTAELPADHNPRTCLDCRPILPEPDSLDAAWAEAEAALPKRGFWHLTGLTRRVGGSWRASAGLLNDTFEHYVVRRDGFGPTPTAALRALAERLRTTA
jgi:hypothetical protein